MTARLIQGIKPSFGGFLLDWRVRLNKSVLKTLGDATIRQCENHETLDESKQTLTEMSRSAIEHEFDEDAYEDVSIRPEDALRTEEEI